MKKHMLPLAVAMMAGVPLLAAAQQDTRSMSVNPSARACAMGMHAMMMGMAGDGMMGEGMMRPGAGRMRDTMGGMRGERGDEMRDRMGRGMMNDSSMMAEMQSRLGLSDAQLQQMRDIHQRACTAAQPHLQEAMQARQAAMQALQGDKPSLDHFEDQLDKANKHMVMAQVELAKGVLAARKVLTPAQRQQLDQMHHQMRGGMNPG